MKSYLTIEDMKAISIQLDIMNECQSLDLSGIHASDNIHRLIRELTVENGERTSLPIYKWVIE